MKATTKSLFNVPVVYHIGYQGRDIDSFLETLEVNLIDVLIDLREKPFSRVKGFSKNQLGRALAEFDIDYFLRGSALGGLTVQREVWVEGCKEIAAIAKDKTVAIMCMERNPNQCHRKELVRIIEGQHGLVGVAL